MNKEAYVHPPHQNSRGGSRDPPNPRKFPKAKTQTGRTSSPKCQERTSEKGKEKGREKGKDLKEKAESKRGWKMNRKFKKM